MTLALNFRLQRGDLGLNLEMTIPPRATIALLGENGSGKSSTLLAAAGLLPIDSGSIALGSQLLDGGKEGPFVRPKDRNAGVVFQDLRLIPHLSALQNVAYPLRAKRVPRQEAEAQAADWLLRMGLAKAHQRAKPQELSGGQAQRVAIARALAMEPAMLLLDEPLSAVDAKARAELRKDLRAHLEQFAGPKLLILHDLEDALALADSVFVLEAGRIVQSGTIEELAKEPRSRYVADLIGLNCYPGVSESGRVRIGETVITAATALVGAVWVTIHPRAVSLFRDAPSGSPRNVFCAEIERIEGLLDRVRVRLIGPLAIVAEVTPAAISALSLKIGDSIWVAVKATEVSVSPR